MMDKKKVDEWLSGPYDEATKQEILRLAKEAPQELADSFFKDLSFGTGGMRGVMGVGTNRLNIYTIRAATQGLANYLKKQSTPKNGFSVFIGYDSRRNSKQFAEETARVLAGNQIRVLLSKEICPTPLVSYGCRHYHCSAAVMITASHNPPQYNGYKVYWQDGGQIVPPQDEGIIEEVRRINNPTAVQLAPLHSPLIQSIGKELDESYLDAIAHLRLVPHLHDLNILYTPLHGTGIRIIPEALHSWGYKNITLVTEQKSPDPNFTFAPSPNPEEEKALELGTKQLLKENRDLLIATDPDADRMGIVVRHGGKAVRLTGNQIGCLMLYHICSKQKLSSKTSAIKTIVTTELFAAIAKKFDVECIDVLTGFKYIAEKMTQWEENPRRFLFGAEESYGYLYGNLVRDKDAIIASCLIAEAAASAKKEDKTLVDLLYQIYQTFGVHREALASLNFPDSAEGMAQMESMMKKLRTHPPKAIHQIEVTSIEDYKSGEALHLTTHTTSSLTLPKSDVLRFWLSDGSKLVIRPSGTEPKVKIYAEVVSHSSKIDQAIADSDLKLKQIIDAFRTDVTTL